MYASLADPGSPVVTFAVALRQKRDDEALEVALVRAKDELEHIKITRSNKLAARHAKILVKEQSTLNHGTHDAQNAHESDDKAWVRVCELIEDDPNESLSMIDMLQAKKKKKKDADEDEDRERKARKGKAPRGRSDTQYMATLITDLAAQGVHRH